MWWFRYGYLCLKTSCSNQWVTMNSVFSHPLKYWYSEIYKTNIICLLQHCRISIIILTTQTHQPPDWLPIHIPLNGFDRYCQWNLQLPQHHSFYVLQRPLRVWRNILEPIKLTLSLMGIMINLFWKMTQPCGSQNRMTHCFLHWSDSL